MRDRLVSTRAASQTCQHWRDVALSHPLIWSKLILISDQHSIEWSKKIIDRAGDTSPLWVEAKIRFSNCGPIETLFGDVLHRFWERIQSLHIDTSYSYSAILPHLHRPAPILRSFSIYHGEHEYMVSRYLPQNLFADEAPLLRIFTCSQFRIPQPPNWISTITTLNVYPVSFENLIKVLSACTHALQLLRIYRPKNYVELHCHDTVSQALSDMSNFILPRLAHIEATMSVAAFNALWSMQSTSPAESSTHISVSFSSSSLEPIQHQHRRDFRTAIQNLFHHQNGLGSYTSDMQWQFTISESRLCIKVTSSSLELNFSVSFLWESWARSPHVYRFLTKSLQPYIDNVFHINLDIISPNLPGYILQYFFEILASMNRVAMVTLSGNFIAYCNTIEAGSQQPLFPKLEKLYCNRQVIGENGYIYDLITFLDRRISIGRALPTLIMTDKENYINEVSDKLSSILGLQIVHIPDEIS